MHKKMKNPKTCLICNNSIDPKTNRRFERITCSPNCSRIYKNVSDHIYTLFKPPVLIITNENPDSLEIKVDYDNKYKVYRIHGRLKKAG